MEETVELLPGIIVGKDHRVINGHIRLGVLKDMYPGATLLMRPINFGSAYEVFALQPATKTKEEPPCNTPPQT